MKRKIAPLNADGIDADNANRGTAGGRAGSEGRDVAADILGVCCVVIIGLFGYAQIFLKP